MTETDLLATEGLPRFLPQAKRLAEEIGRLSRGQQKALWRCNDRLTDLNRARFEHMELTAGLTPAVLSYEGLQYQHMAPAVMTQSELDYLRDHLRILSGFYGLLRPFDGVRPYRLEMQAALAVDGAADLYRFWGSLLSQALAEEEPGGLLLNLASKEYARAVEPYWEGRRLTVVFAELSGGRLRQKGTLAKMARGEMVRFLAERGIEQPEGLKAFDRLGFRWDAGRSSEEEMVFVKDAER